MLTAKNMMLVVEGVKIFSSENILDTSAALFACFYVFNMVYSEGTANTLEFIQR